MCGFSTLAHFLDWSLIVIIIVSIVKKNNSNIIAITYVISVGVNALYSNVCKKDLSLQLSDTKSGDFPKDDYEKESKVDEETKIDLGKLQDNDIQETDIRKTKDATEDCPECKHDMQPAKIKSDGPVFFTNAAADSEDKNVDNDDKTAC